MAVKVAKTKAYDMIEWVILLNILEVHDFDNAFCKSY